MLGHFHATVSKKNFKATELAQCALCSWTCARSQDVGNSHGPLMELGGFNSANSWHRAVKENLMFSLGPLIDLIYRVLEPLYIILNGQWVVEITVTFDGGLGCNGPE